MTKKFFKYFKVLRNNLYRPVKPVINPLVKKIKLIYVLGFLVGIGLIGSLWFGWQTKGYEKTAWWPWSTRAHSQMALEYFQAGDEQAALNELKLANKLLIIKTNTTSNKLKIAEEKIRQPGKIRNKITAWEKVLEEKPYYRDILLRLAILNWQIYEDEKAIDYWNRANYLDPNNESVQKVGKIISAYPYP